MEKRQDHEKETLLFRVVPTMQCNFRCDYCFLDKKRETGTMFDEHNVAEWVKAMENYKDYNIELYFWGGEPFCIDETYDLIKGWTQYEHVIGGIRIDTNCYFADKIAKRCPTNKVKLNCSFHMQYLSLDEEYRKVKELKDLDMIGMVNFVASPYNMKKLKESYKMTVRDLVEKFAEIGVFMNIAGDFAYANNEKYDRLNEYRDFIEQFTSPEDWDYLRGLKGRRMCTAGQKMFTVNHNGDFTSCISDKIYGNFFEGNLKPDKEPAACSKNCPSIITYPFHCDNDFPVVNSLLAYVERNQKYRKEYKKPYKDFLF